MKLKAIRFITDAVPTFCGLQARTLQAGANGLVLEYDPETSVIVATRPDRDTEVISAVHCVMVLAHQDAKRKQ